jgi:hypothetical protein
VIVTNLHVIRGDIRVSIRLSNGDIYDDVSVVDVDERKDLVLLKIKAINLTPTILGDSEQVKVGDKVVLIGSPKGLDWTVSDGIISSLRDSGEGYRLFQTSAAASPGSSGGGMFNEYGELVGIVSAKVKEGENLNFAIPVNYVRGLFSTQSRMTLAELTARLPADSSTSSHSSGSASDSAGAKVDIAGMLKLLEASGLNYKKTGESSWSVSYKGDNLPVVVVNIWNADGYTVFASTVARKPRLTPEKMHEIMRANYAFNLAKAALDEDQDLIVLNEAETRLLDGAGLERIADMVASAADDVAGLLNGATARETMPELRMPANASRLGVLNLLQGHSAIRYDSSSWKAEAASEPGEHQYEHVSGDLWVKVITERLEIPQDSMEKIVLTNAQSVDPSAKVTRRGVRQVNGQRMLVLEIETTTKGIPFIIYSHNFSDKAGTLQIIAWTGKNLLNEYRSTVDSFVAGFEVRRE